LLGITAVLHTWTRDLRFHPHLHCVVTGGGLALDAQRWVYSGGKFIFPVKYQPSSTSCGDPLHRSEYQGRAIGVGFQTQEA